MNPAVSFSRLFLLTLCLLLLNPGILGQMSRKPSASQQPASAGLDLASSAKNSIPRVADRAEFDSIARTYHPGTPHALPHAMFVIDRRSRDKVYFVNSKRFRFHKDFLLATYLVPRGADVFKPIYIDQDRRFVVGTIAWQATVEKFTWELWEGDLASAEIIKSAHQAINSAFFDEVHYKPNSIRQEDATASIGINRVLQDELNRNQSFLTLNPGTAVGRIHIIDKLDDTVEIGSNEIVVLKELPISLPPVRGVIVAQPSSPLSHINILAKGWNIPNVYIKNADKLFREHNTYVFKLEASLTDYKLNPADLEEIKTSFTSPDQQIPPSDLTVRRVAPLREMRKKDSVAYGAKSANLGEMLNFRLTGVNIPDGFGVPYFWYDKFMKDNGLYKIIEAHMDDLEFVHNPRYRRQKLEEFRNLIQKGEFDPELRTTIIARWKKQLLGKPVFVRSSSNAEDLPNFSGAGLYSSVPNVIEENKLIEAVKKVWASLWNFDGYEARVRNYVSQNDVYMAALIQVGINMEKGGVMITKDPFDDGNKNAVYISAVCGHNSRVVSNTGIPEQILFNPTSNSVVVMTLSQQQNALTFDDHGDLRETVDKCAGSNKRVLNDLQARTLARAAVSIKRVFGGKKEQDVEWGILRGRVFIVQARPYIENK